MLSTQATIEVAPEPIHSDVVALREEIFPGTNTTGVHLLRLVGSRPDGLEERCEGDLVGYVVTELRDAEPLCIDGLVVSDASCSQNVSRAFVGAAVQAQADEATYPYFVVQVSDTAARRAVRLCWLC